MTDKTDIAALLQEEKGYAREVRSFSVKGTDTAMALVLTRVQIGAWCEEQAKMAKANATDWDEWCANSREAGVMLFSRVRADRYRRVYQAKDYAIDLAKKGAALADLDEAVKLLPTQAEAKRMGYATGGPKKRESNEWLTPAEYIEAARATMGRIDFDPFSSIEANATVRAGDFFSVEDDAFVTPWPVKHAAVWMNPPYGVGNMAKAVSAFLRHLQHMEQAIVLVNNATDTEWYHALAEHCAAKVETNGRIAFESDSKQKSSNTRGQMFLYFGEHTTAFYENFARYGACWRPCYPGPLSPLSPPDGSAE